MSLFKTINKIKQYKYAKRSIVNHILNEHNEFSSKQIDDFNNMVELHFDKKGNPTKLSLNKLNNNKNKKRNNYKEKGQFYNSNHNSLEDLKYREDLYDTDSNIYAYNPLHSPYKYPFEYPLADPIKYPFSDTNYK